VTRTGSQFTGRDRLTSVIALDQEAINIAVELHLDRTRPWPPVILDCTYERGAMWRGLDLQPTFKADIRPRGPDVEQVDYRRLDEHYAASSVDLLVFDPPHAMDGGHSGGMGEHGWADRYGTLTEVTRWSRNGSGGAGKAHRLSIAWTFEEFLQAAAKVLVPDGILLAKLGDQTHGAEQQFEHCHLWAMSQELGMRPCDLLVKVRREAKRIDPKHRTQYHADKVHCFFVIIRNGKKC
jgi:hypothetical protein